MCIDLKLWREYVAGLEIEPLFVTVSGAHLYGFPSPGSDVDLRGCHRLPLRKVVGLRPADPTFQREGFHEEIEIDIVSHDIAKYFGLLVKNNGYVLEQIFSPLIVTGHDFLQKLRPIAERCVTRHHYHHYRGFYGTQRKLIEKETQKRAKPVLYAYRVLLTGIHLMQTGEVEADLLKLNEKFRLPQIADLVASKTAEKIAPKDLDWDFHAKELHQLEGDLDEAFERSSLGEERAVQEVDELLVSLRLADGNSDACSANDVS